MNADDATALVLAPTYGDWNEFCRAKGIGTMRPCPICGAAGQVGPVDAQADLPMVAIPDLAGQMRLGTLTQECDNCGYRMTFSLAPFVDWLVAK